MQNGGYDNYQGIDVTTADQGKLILMAYEGAINFAKIAKERLAANDYAGKSINISNAVEIINELRCRLDIEKGGETAKNLNNLYMFLSMQLTTANLKRDIYKIDEAIKILETLYNGWVNIVELEKKKALNGFNDERETVNLTANVVA